MPPLHVYSFTKICSLMQSTKISMTKVFSRFIVLLVMSFNSNYSHLYSHIFCGSILSISGMTGSPPLSVLHEHCFPHEKHNSNPLSLKSLYSWLLYSWLTYSITSRRHFCRAEIIIDITVTSQWASWLYTSLTIKLFVLQHKLSITGKMRHNGKHEINGCISSRS